MLAFTRKGIADMKSQRRTNGQYVCEIAQVYYL